MGSNDLRRFVFLNKNLNLDEYFRELCEGIELTVVEGDIPDRVPTPRICRPSAAWATYSAHGNTITMVCNGGEDAAIGGGWVLGEDDFLDAVWVFDRGYRSDRLLVSDERHLGAGEEIHNHELVVIRGGDPAAMVGADEPLLDRLAQDT